MRKSKRSDRDLHEIRCDISQGAILSPTFAWMNALAAVVASYGLLMNSAAVVIGAMIIATLLGPITGISLALVEGDRALFRAALFAEMLGALLVLGISLAIGRIHANLPLGAEIHSRTSPNLMDLIVALAGGAAGAYAIINPKISANLVGVAVATALVPPLATCGICLARGDAKQGFGGFALYFANLIAIQVASSFVLGLNGFHGALPSSRTPAELLKRYGPSLGILAALVVGLGYNLQQTVRKLILESSVRAQLSHALEPYASAQLAGVRFLEGPGETEVIALVYNTGSFSPEDVTRIESGLKPPSGEKIDLRLQSVLVKETTSQGYSPVTSDTEIRQTQ
jgi:uncharacterized hydrophobic protein (TIGR00271 family)